MWQSVLRSWFRGKAAEQVQQSARRRVIDAGQQPLPPCDVAVVFALAVESGGLVDLLGDVIDIRGHGFVARCGKLEGRNVVVGESGPGGEAAARATAAILRGHRPQWVVSAGFAGGLDPRLARGDILMADHVADLAGDQLAIGFDIPAEEVARTPGLHVGRLLTVDQIIRQPQEKLSLGETHDALAVDMESMAVARVCQREKVRFLCVRVISDAQGDRLPAEIDHLLRQTSRAGRWGAATGAIFRRPSSVKDMLQLKEHALLASDRLAKFLAGTVTQLVPENDTE